jgi:cell division protein ZapB|tara:strand:- start:16463 stop:16669 length:207 start_codon:yes stop_codon:yes gene_type:complete
MSVNLEKFELKIDSIIAHCAKLQKENLSLKKRESELLVQRSNLLEKQELTCTRLENLIKRLKSLNDGT